ncbi:MULTISPECIES: hypothetical protein [Streptomyces]|uniref:Uncharacterized protein n=3 Tax=Streptomyces TaxID=1883 RepID=A0A8H9HKG5_9ACTN|nr:MULTISPECIES: hypothetical protein [Streptomyces]NEE42083.1 hypothetical protein [Streptomyces sp. SID7982]MDQ0295334.1 hypothetical protein [Streptomyces sp. DSM 41037]RPK91697.1 hypothetical protein EES47_04700 [Streptomyces sp. ADI98-12]WPR51296.1 hypothetical protein SJI45_09865 [Streptomyces sp. S399]SUP62349.1 Uncharacterised protein [Streptomyces griseus]
MTTTRLNRYDRAMVRIMNDRRAQPLYATAVRRRLVVATHLALTLAIGGLIAHSCLGAGNPAWALVLVVALLLPWAVATGAINGATRGLLELRERALDERQSAERAQVRARAHLATTLLLAATAVGLLTVGAVSGDAPTAYAAPVLVTVLAVHWLMPLWVAGLTAQDEPAEDDGLEA